MYDYEELVKDLRQQIALKESKLEDQKKEERSTIAQKDSLYREAQEKHSRLAQESEEIITKLSIELEKATAKINVYLPVT